MRKKKYFFGFVFIFVSIRFEDFDIDQFVDYLQNDDDIANNNNHESTPSPERQTGYENQPATQSSSATERFFYTCTVCREILSNSQELLRHIRTHTRLKALKSEESQKVGEIERWNV
jgi:hypothetical protein